MNDVKLNLARKWRSRNFDQIVGQDVSVRMLKNSLYRDHYFPVYLFSGQRGCGKTSTARVFACAINCEKLGEFQKDPKSTLIPCLTCASCQALMSGKHPDFIEMDAASHTGVDNVRQIVDSSTLLPLMGRKKIYLIDEAHMLSKAAFNAFLKILEEPPSSVLFILATTDTQKIIDTVKSRCFQLIFRPIEHTALHSHLMKVCKTENIVADADALDVIIKETNGSARDALNLLEQVRFSSARVSKETVLSVLGHIDDQRLIDLCKKVLQGGPADVLQLLRDMHFEEHSPEFMWRRLIELVRALIWVKHDIPPIQFGEHMSALRAMARACTWNRLRAMLSTFCLQENAFTKTTAKHALLEMILLQLCAKKTNNDGPTGASSLQHQPEVASDGDYEQDEEEDGEDEEEEEIVEEEGAAAPWGLFLKKVEAIGEPIIHSVLKSGKLKSFDAPTGKLAVEFSKKFVFFKDSLDETASLWMPILRQVFGENVNLFSEFNGSDAATPQPVRHAKPEITQSQKFDSSKKAMGSHTQKRTAYASHRTQRAHAPQPVFDVSDTELWQKAHMLLQYFPGRITEIKE